MGAMRATLEGGSGGEEWTERNPALHRALLRTDQFLAADDAKQPPEAAVGGRARQTAPGAQGNSGGTR